MYYPELTPITSDNSAVYYMVGWLDNEHPFPKGKVSQLFIDRLWAYCSHSEFLVYGYHFCPFCKDPPFGMLMEHNGESEKLGDGEIRVIIKEGFFFASPDLIFHYVVDHNYSPPEEFIQAILEAPLPGSKEYNDIAELYHWF